MKLGMRMMISLFLGMSVARVFAAPADVSGFPQGQEKQLQISDDLQRQITDVITLQGAATENQILIREQAFLTALKNQSGLLVRDSQAAILAALQDPEVQSAGIGEAVVAAPSGGGPCGQGPDGYSCAAIMCGLQEDCRNRYGCGPSDWNCFWQGTRCRMEAINYHAQCLSSPLMCGGSYSGLSELSGCPTDAKCKDSVTNRHRLEINSAGTSYNARLIFNSNPPLPLRLYRVRVVSLAGSQLTQEVYYDSVGCISSYNEQLPPIPVKSVNGRVQTYIFVEVIVDLDCLGKVSKNANFDYRLVCLP